MVCNGNLVPRMPKIELYTTPICPYCLAAKELLQRKGAAFTEFNVMGNAEKRQEVYLNSYRRGLTY